MTSAQSEPVVPLSATVVKVGGTVAITIPAPSAEFVEVGPDNRSVLDVLVPGTNRLLCAFVKPDDLARLNVRDPKLKFDRYMLVEVYRRFETTELTPSQFQELKESLNTQFDVKVGATVGDMEAELNRKLKEAGGGSVSLGKPMPLGAFFVQDSAAAYGMLAPVSAKDKTVNMVVSTVFLNINKRLIYIYIYSVYDGEPSVQWVKKTSEEWVSLIQKTNSQTP